MYMVDTYQTYRRPGPAWALLLCAAFSSIQSCPAQSWRGSTHATTQVIAQTADRLTVADFDGDGLGDVAIAADHDLEVFRGDGRGVFTELPNSTVVYVDDLTSGDFNGDGKQDLLIVGAVDHKASSSLGVFLLSGNGRGSFGQPEQVTSLYLPTIDSSCHISAGVFTKQHTAPIDFVLACASAPSSLTIAVNSGLGTFEVASAIPVLPAGMEILDLSAGDTSGQGLSDVLIIDQATRGATSRSVDLLRNTGVGFTLQSGVLSAGDRAILADYDGDSLADILEIDAGQLLFRRSEGSTFAPVKTVARDASCRDLDLAAGNLQGIPGDLALDVALAHLCDSLSGNSTPTLEALLNTAGTKLTITATPRKATPEVSDVSVNVSPLEAKGVPSGTVLLSSPGNATQQVQLAGGAGTSAMNLASGEQSKVTAVYTASPQFGASFAHPELIGSGTISVNGPSRLALGQSGNFNASDSCTYDRSSITGFTIVGNAGVEICTATVGGSPHGSCYGGGSLLPGTYTVTAEVDGAPACATYTYSSFQLVVGKSSPTLSLSVSGATYPGSSVASLVLSGASSPTGAITVSINGNQFANASYTGSPSSGVYSYSVAMPIEGGGSYSVSANFTGDVGNNSTSASTTYTVAKGNTSSAVSCSPNPITYGPQTTNCPSSVSGSGGGAAPTGTVTYTDNGSVFATPTLSNGSTSAGGFNYAGAGSHTVGLTYGGDSNWNGSSTSTVLTINKVNSSITVNCSPNPITYGPQYTTCGESLSSDDSSGSGTVTFTINGNTYETETLTSPTSASFSGFNNNSPGTLTVGATYNGDSNHNPASGSTTLTIVKATPAVTVSCSPNPRNYGPLVDTCTAAVPADATGHIALTDNGNLFTNPSVSGGSASGSGFDYDGTGAHTIGATYSGDSNYNAASASTTLTINPDPTFTQLSATPTSTTQGSAVNLSTIVNTGGGNPTGNVTFSSGGQTIGSSPITAVSVTNQRPYSNQFDQWPGGDGPTLTANAGTAPDGTNSAWLVSVSQGSPYYVEETIPCSGNQQIIDSVWFKFPTTNPANSLLFWAKFFDANGAAVGGQAPGILYSQASGGWQLMTNTSMVPATAVSCWISIEVGPPSSGTGGLLIWGAQTEFGTATPGPYVATGSSAVSAYGGTAQLSYSGLAPGMDAVTAQYVGDSNTAASTSFPVDITVSAITPTGTLTSSLNPSALGQAVNFTCSMQAGSSPATGNVTFSVDGALQSDSYTLTNGSATWSTSALAVGSHDIRCSGPNNSNNPNISVDLTQIVGKATPTLVITASLASLTYGSPLTLTGSTTPTTATGLVAFADGAVPVGSSNLAGGAAALSLPLLTPGSHSFAASYAGDLNDSPATSGVVVVTVAKSPITFTVSSSVNPSDYKQPVTFTIVAHGVAGGAVPTGSVTITDGATTLGTVPLLSGTATLLSPTLSVRSHTLTITYNGDTNYR